MLGKRSRPLQSKFHLMSPESRDCTAPNKSKGFFNTPRLLGAFNSKIARFSDGEGGSRSPTSTLDAKVFCDQKPCRSPRGFDHPDCQGVGLGILAALHRDRNITPKTTLLSPKTSHKTPIPVKTIDKRSQPISIGSARPPSEPRDDDRLVMEYSESYTCITSHGPKPSIRQIFNDPVEDENRNLKCCKPAVFETAASFSYASAPTSDFLSVCYLCRRQLRHGKDIYMYRGDKAFCSVECRYQQIVSDEKERCASSTSKKRASPQAPSFYYPFSSGTMAAA